MDVVWGLVGGLGILGLLGAGVLAFLVFLVLPWWALIDCATSRRREGGRAGLIVLLVLTWGVGSVVYGLFVTSSRLLRGFTILMVGAIGLVAVPSVLALGASASRFQERSREETRRAAAELSAQFTPATVAGPQVPAFRAMHVSYAGAVPLRASLAPFATGAPQLDEAQDVDPAVRHVAYDADGQRYFALTTHEFGTVAASGRFAAIAVDPAVGELSWPKGLAYDADAGLVYVMTAHVTTGFLRFEPRTSRWQRLPAEIRDLPLVGLAYVAGERALYGVELRDGALRRLHRFNTSGASTGVVTLAPAVPVRDTPDLGVQLHAAGDQLALLVPPVAEPGAAAAAGASSGGLVLVVDPATGAVRRVAPAGTTATR